MIVPYEGTGNYLWPTAMNFQGGLIEFHDAVHEEKIERRLEKVESVLVDRKLTFRAAVFSCFTARVTSRAEES